MYFSRACRSAQSAGKGGKPTLQGEIVRTEAQISRYRVEFYLGIGAGARMKMRKKNLNGRWLCRSHAELMTVRPRGHKDLKNYTGSVNFFKHW